MSFFRIGFRAPWDTADTERRDDWLKKRKAAKEEEEGLVIPWVIGECGFSPFTGKNGTAFQEYGLTTTSSAMRLTQILTCRWYQTNTGHDDMDDYMEIEKYGKDEGELFDDLTPLNWWEPNNGYEGSNNCNLLRGTDGQQFHPDITKEEKIWVYQTDICRTIFGEYKEEVEIKGISGYKFVGTYEVFQTSTKLNLGFCLEWEADLVNWNECVREDPSNPDLLILDDCDLPYRTCPDGIMEITRCMEGAPTAMSAPYFYLSPNFLREDFEDFGQPVEELHNTVIVVEPVSGSALEILKRLQASI